MKKKIAYGLLVVMIVAATAVASVLAYSLVAGITPFADYYAIYEAEGEDTLGVDEPEEVVHATPMEVTHHQDGIARISLGTVMVYEHYDATTSTFERIEESPSQVLLGMSREEVSAMFVDWRILYFSPYQVHLRQNDALEHRQFTIATHEGFIAVFYDNDQTTIKELTNRPIHALAPEERDRLAEGITVRGNEELIRALEDFGS